MLGVTMAWGLFLGFLAISFIGAMWIFRFSTYHALFLKALPFLVAFAVGVGYMMARVPSLAPFWFTQVWASAVLFWLLWLYNRKQLRALLEGTDDDAAKKVILLSAESTKAYYWLSVVIYLITYVISYIILFNTLGYRPG